MGRKLREHENASYFITDDNAVAGGYSQIGNEAFGPKWISRVSVSGIGNVRVHRNAEFLYWFNQKMISWPSNESAYFSHNNISATPKCLIHGQKKIPHPWVTV